MTRLISKIKNLIRAPMHRIGAYTQLDMNYLVRGGFWLTFGQVVGIGSSLIVAIAYANLLPKEAYGLYKYIMSVAGILGVFMLTGMLTPISRTVAKGKDTILAGAIRYQLRWSSIFVAISTAAAAYYWLQGNQAIAWSLLILAAGTPFIRSLNSFGSYLTGKKDFRLNTIIDTISGLFVAAAVIATISITNSVIALIGVYAASNLIANGAGYWVTIRKYPQATTTALDEDTKNFGKSLSVLGALGAIPKTGCQGIHGYPFFPASARSSINGYRRYRGRGLHRGRADRFPIFIPGIPKRRLLLPDHGPLARIFRTHALYRVYYLCADTCL